MKRPTGALGGHTVVWFAIMAAFALVGATFAKLIGVIP